MTRGRAVSNLGGYLIGLTLACGVLRTVGAVDAPKNFSHEELSVAVTRLTDLVSSIAQKEKEFEAIKAEAVAQRRRIASTREEELSAAESRLTELTSSISQKEKELKAIKAEAVAQRRRIASTIEPEGTVHLNVKELLIGMPKEAYPVREPNGSIDGTASVKWLQEKLAPGKNYVEWEAMVKDVSYGSENLSPVALIIDAYAIPTIIGRPGQSIYSWPINEPILLGDQSCIVMVPAGVRHLDSPVVQYGQCTTDEVSMLRRLKGKKATFRGHVNSVKVSDVNVPTSTGTYSVKIQKHVCIELGVYGITANDFLPAASILKEKK